MVFGELRLRKSEERSRDGVIRREGATVVSPALVVVAVFFSLMLVIFLGDGGVGVGGWIVLAEGSNGGAGKNGYSGGGFWSSAVAPSNVGLAVAVTAMAGIAVAATVVYSRRGSLRSPWSRKRRRHALLPKQWKSFFTPEGKLSDGGVRFLKKVRSGGVDPSIRSEVWPFLLGMYDLNSTKAERDSIRQRKQKEYENLRKQCHQIHRRNENNTGLEQTVNSGSIEDSGELSQVLDSRDLEEVDSARRSVSPDGGSTRAKDLDQPASESVQDGVREKSIVTSEDASVGDSDSSDSESSEESETLPLLADEVDGENEDYSPSAETRTKTHTDEDFATWQRIIRLDAVRANDEWVSYSPSQSFVSETKARRLATRVGLNDYDHLEPCRVFHAARLVAILEAYAVYDPEIGYCQGMSDLLSPIITVVEEDDVAFWCFMGFMRKARHNFRLDEVGIRRQLSIVSKIIMHKDNHLYRHLEKLEAEDCFFVYRMVVVLFRRELTFEQTLCLWEVMWADQAAIRAGIAKSTWGRIRMRAPPTEDLLLYAIAASVLQRRKTIIEKYCSMDEIMRECNSMAGHLDVWRLLDDAHNLVVNLHDKI